MTNESVIRILERLTTNHDWLLRDIQILINKSATRFEKLKDDLQKEKEEQVVLKVNDEVIANGLHGYVVYIKSDPIHEYREARYLIEFEDTIENELTHEYLKREDITKC